MSRRPANVTQADVTRALRAAQQAGLTWRVEMDGKVIRLVQAPLAANDPQRLQPPESPLASEEKWRL